VIRVGDVPGLREFLYQYLGAWNLSAPSDASGRTLPLPTLLALIQQVL